MVERNRFALEPRSAAFAHGDRREGLGEKQGISIGRLRRGDEHTEGRPHVECEIARVVGREIVFALDSDIALMRAEVFAGQREIDRLRLAGPPVERLLAARLRHAFRVEHVDRHAALFLGPDANRLGFDLHLAIFGKHFGADSHIAQRKIVRLGHADIDHVNGHVAGVFQ